MMEMDYLHTRFFRILSIAPGVTRDKAKSGGKIASRGVTTPLIKEYIWRIADLKMQMSVQELCDFSPRQTIMAPNQPSNDNEAKG